MSGNVGNNTGKGLPPGQLPLNAEEGSGGTGAHAILVDGDYLIYACPPARQIFWINKKTWKVKTTWPVPGNRTHGMGWGKDRRPSGHRTPISTPFSITMWRREISSRRSSCRMTCR